MEYRTLEPEELCLELFSGFNRRQVVTKCWRRENGRWCIRDDPFVDDWSPEDYATLVRHLKNTAATGGLVYGAFLDGKLKGFVAVENGLFGGENRYLDLRSLHVSRELRGRGVGTVLFRAAMDWARQQGAAKLYISAHSAVESQAFYRHMGCTEAAQYHQGHAEAEPFDCQMECRLS
ncbi:MAG: GNAT family N-acetyltransferase [Eubacteriales bacterium]|nr:GNAT family N-acetyltransferase [Eubacteriales bacterium]